MSAPSRIEPLPPVAYVLTGGSAAESSLWLAVISMKLLQLLHPKVAVRLLLDPETERFVGQQAPLPLGDGVEMATIETRFADGVSSNRFIKTQLPRWMEGPFLYLDNDTLPVRSLDGIYDPRFDFAAARDYQDGQQEHLCPPCFWELYERMEWSLPPTLYLNGGVFASNGSPEAHSLFEEWHLRWASCREQGIQVDQPALNSLWAEGKWKVRVLPRDFNSLIEVDERFAKNARIYHYTTSYAQLSSYLLPAWVEKLKTGADVTSDLRQFLDSRYIWADQTHARRHWLVGNPRKALEVFWRKRLGSKESG